MMWAKRVLIGSGVAVASLLMVPNVAGAASKCVVSESIQTTSSCVTVPTVQGGSSTVAPAAVTPTDGGTATVTPAADGPTTLPFTGADVEGMAVVGVGAILAGGLLMRRRRMNA
jgi:LPXTG-motif cell wall-anchored protein